MQTADPGLRVRFLLGMILLAAIGAAGILSLEDSLARLHTPAAAPHPETIALARMAVRIFLAVVIAGGTLFSLYLASVSWRTITSERYPPPGTRVISDTRVRHGQPARRRGQAGLALAILTLLLTAVVTARASRIFGRLLATAAPSEQTGQPTARSPSPLLP